MKLKLFAVLLAVYIIVLTSCKKQDIKLTPLASLQVINVVNGGGNLVLGTNAAPVYNNYFQAYDMIIGNKEIKLVDTAGGMDKVYYNQNNEFVNGGVYSLFLGGAPDAVESVFMKEENIASHSENVFGVRVINLSTGSEAISVNVAGAVIGSLIPLLSYKALSEFKKVAATIGQTLEFRNAATGTLIMTFDVPDYDMPRFRNITLVFAGTFGTETIVRVNNY